MSQKFIIIIYVILDLFCILYVFHHSMILHKNEQTRHRGYIEIQPGHDFHPNCLTTFKFFVQFIFPYQIFLVHNLVFFCLHDLFLFFHTLFNKESFHFNNFACYFILLHNLNNIFYFIYDIHFSFMDIYTQKYIFLYN